MRHFLFALATMAFALPAFVRPALADDTTITVATGDSSAITLTSAIEAKVGKVDNKTVVETKAMKLYLWPVPKAKTVADAVGMIDDVIKDEVKGMKADETKTITVGGAEAKHLIGHGKEADDGDDATVDVVVFTVGDKVVAACVHGEGQAAPQQRQPMLDLLGTVKAK